MKGIAALGIVVALALAFASAMLWYESRSIARDGGAIVMSSPLRWVLDSIVAPMTTGASPAETSATLQNVLLAGVGAGIVLLVVGLLLRRRANRRAITRV